MKSSTIVSQHTLLLTFGIVLVLALFFFVIWPWIQGMIQGQCWSNARQTLTGISTEMRNLNNGESTEISVTLGDCAKDLVIARSSDISGKDYKCDASISSFIGARPSLKFLEFFKKLTTDPICVQVPCGSGYTCNIVGESLELKGPGNKESSKSYCISIEKESSSSYIVDEIDLSEC